MKQYYKEIDGKKIFFTGILKTNDVQIFNPTEEQLLSNGWIEYVPSTTIPEETLEDLRFRKLQEIENYDDSEAVNICYIEYQGQTISYWADKSERTALKEAVKDCIDSGIETYRLDLRNYGVSVYIECYKMLSMLQQLEVYAVQCYNKTTDHIYNVQSLTDKSSIETYEYTIGYPEKLTFNINYNDD